MTPIELSYTPDEADFSVELATRPVSARLRLAAIGGLIAAAFLLGWLEEQSAALQTIISFAPPWGEIAAVLALVLACYAAAALLRRAHRSVLVRRLAASASPITVTGSADGFRLTETGVTKEYPWRQVVASWLSPDHVLLAFSDGRAQALPLRVFADRAAMLAFAQDVQAELRADSEREDAAPSSPLSPEPAP
jgi:hypothetical protein